jgi:hypothetical protein
MVVWRARLDLSAAVLSMSIIANEVYVTARETQQHRNSVASPCGMYMYAAPQLANAM